LPIWWWGVCCHPTWDL